MHNTSQLHINTATLHSIMSSSSNRLEKCIISPKDVIKKLKKKKMNKHKLNEDG